LLAHLRFQDVVDVPGLAAGAAHLGVGPLLYTACELAPKNLRIGLDHLLGTERADRLLYCIENWFSRVCGCDSRSDFRAKKMRKVLITRSRFDSMVAQIALVLCPVGFRHRPAEAAV